MSDTPLARGSRSGDPHPRLRLVALTAVIAGVMLLAAAAFLLSYAGIHQIALQAGVSPTLARIYPLIFDAMLVVACAAVLALRGSGRWILLYVWLSLLVLLGAVAAGDAVHAMNIALPRQPSRAGVAIIPWVLLLMGFGMLLAMLRQRRRIRAASASGGTAGNQADGAAANGGTVTWAAAPGAAPARPGSPPTAISSLLEPRTGRPAIVAPGEAHRDDGGTDHEDDSYDAGGGTYHSGDETYDAGGGTYHSGDETYDADSETHDADSGTATRAGAADRPGPAPMVPAPTPVPHFDRMRSTPTPPEDPEADGE
jgi:uncharacterized protein DUF2637